MTTYHYGSDGLRDKKTTGSDTIKYYCDENGIVLNEANANGSHRATNVVGADGTIIARKNQSGDIGKFIKNEHGDVTNVIGETASNTYKYEPWGTITAKTGTFDNPIRYSGEYYDDESGLIYLRNRYYDPSLRRFISEDPHWNTGNMIYGDDTENKIPNIAAILQSSNLYAYCINNPVNYADPFGSVAYEKFATALDAAIDWVWNNYGKTDYVLIEFASVLFSAYDENGKLYFSYTWGIQGTPHTVASMDAAAMIPIGAKIEGTIHSHPTGDEFSDDDRKNMIWYGLNYSFLAVPTEDRTVAKLLGLTAGDTTEYGYAYVRYKPLTVRDKQRLTRKFYDIWQKHYKDPLYENWCNEYHCRTRRWPH